MQRYGINSQNIKYGESFSQIFSSDPSDAAPLGMIVGIDGNGKSFVGFDVSNIVIKQKVPVIGTIEVPLEQAILALVPDGKVTVGNLMTVINKLPDLGDNAGIISAVQKVVNQILKIYPAAADWSISFKRQQNQVYTLQQEHLQARTTHSSRCWIPDNCTSVKRCKTGVQ